MAKHLHIPLQSGSDTILKSMNRLYNVNSFVEKISHIRKEIPDISITTDLILGFPGETDEYFKETLDTLNKIKFTKIHTFPYSKRSGTKAASMPNQVDGNIKKCRVKEVLSLSDKYELAFYKQKIGNTYDGIIETRKDGKNTDLDNNMIVNVKIHSVTDSEIKGKIV